MKETSFSADEALRLAVQMEQLGQELYGTLARRCSQKKVREILDFLLSEEKRHQELFERLLGRMRDRLVMESASGEYAAYLRAIAREWMDTDRSAQKLIQKRTPRAEELLDFALKLESDSIVFYQQILRQMTKDTKIVKAIVQEEQRHYTTVSSLKDKYKGETL